MAFRYGFLCFLVGILKECCELDRRERRFVMCAAGLLKMASSVAIAYSPESARHIICSSGCAISLVLLIIGAVIDNLGLMCGDGHRRGVEGQAIMGAGAFMSSISGSFKITIHLIEYVFS